jgi:YVTN family beta-propeller protein
VIDLIQNTVAHSIGLDPRPWAVALDPTETRLYVLCQGGNILAVVDTRTRIVAARIPIPALSPFDTGYALAVHPSGNPVYVLGGKSPALAVIDVVRGAQIGTLDNRGDQLPSASLAIDSTGAQLYIPNPSFRSFFDPPPASMFVTVVDTAGLAPVVSIAIPDQPTGVVRPAQTNTNALDNVTNVAGLEYTSDVSIVQECSHATSESEC